MIHKGQLKELVEETIKDIGFYSEEATELILGTIAQESHFGTYLRQLGNGPALGICQMEPATHHDIWKNFVTYKKGLEIQLMDIAVTIVSTFDKGGVSRPTNEELVWNLKYSIAMCRVHYLRKKGAIPKDTEGQAAYWKEHYNTHLGKGTTKEYIRNYNKFVR